RRRGRDRAGGRRSRGHHDDGGEGEEERKSAAEHRAHCTCTLQGPMKKNHLLPPFLALALLALPLLAQTKLAPPSPQVQKTIQSALEEAQKGDLKGAIALLEPLKKPGAHPAALSLLGSLYLETGRPQDALAL